MSRKEKLFYFLKAIGIVQYRYLMQDIELSEDIIGELIVSRNKLFHQSSDFNESLLWMHLFQIVREVVGIAARNNSTFA